MRGLVRDTSIIPTATTMNNININSAVSTHHLAPAASCLQTLQITFSHVLRARLQHRINLDRPRENPRSATSTSHHQHVHIGLSLDRKLHVQCAGTASL